LSPKDFKTFTGLNPELQNEEACKKIIGDLLEAVKIVEEEKY
jgi:hypothetical protein